MVGDFSGVFRVGTFYFCAIVGCFLLGGLFCWFWVEWVLKFVECLVYIVWRGYCDV